MKAIITADHIYPPEDNHTIVDYTAVMEDVMPPDSSDVKTMIYAAYKHSCYLLYEPATFP